MKTLRSLQRLSLFSLSLSLLLALTAIGSSAQTFATLATFDGSNGVSPSYGSLVQDSAGNFYGTTLSGGDITTYCSDGQGFGCGTIFKIATDGTLTTLHVFCSVENCADGVTPFGGLILGPNGNFYGTTANGGASFSGIVFEITPEGQLTTLYNFCSQTNCANGEYPYAGLTLGANGNFYGTTTYGGAHNAGTIFSITPSGKLTTLYSFCSQSNCADGEFVYGPLLQAKNGQFYGATTEGGAHEAGTVFSITAAGKFVTLHNFDYKDGAFSYGRLVQAAKGNLMGTTLSGGLREDGTIFQMTPAGKVTTLYNFCANAYCTDGAGPFAGLLKGANGNFYGTTGSGGTGSQGTIFEITPAGKLTTLYSFCSKTGCADGEVPLAGLVQATDGSLYGTTEEGGDRSCPVGVYGCGTVFSILP